MKTQRIRILCVVAFLAILLLTFSSSPASAGQAQGGSTAPKSSASTCTQLIKADGVPTPNEINFDDLKVDTVIDAYYQSTNGVVFEDTKTSIATIQQDSTAPSQPNDAVNLPVKPATSANQPMTITFDEGKSAVGMTIGGGDSSTTTATLTAFDVSGVEICHVTYSPVPAGVTAFLGLKDDAGAEIRMITIDYGAAVENETIDNLLFSSYVPPLPCAVSLKGFPASVNVGSRVVVTWNVAKNSYYATQTYLVYDSVSHPQTGTYSGYQVPSPNTGSGDFSSGILARAAGTLYIRPALSYQETAGAVPETCQGADEITVTVNAVSPTPPPTPGSISGFVTTSKGVGLAGVKVKACVGLICQSATSKASGAYTIANLSPADYTLTANLAGYNPFNSRATVSTSHVTSATITLSIIPTPPPPPTTGSINGHVLEQGTANTPVNAASLELRPSIGNSSTYFAYATSDASGFFTFTNVPVGDWLVFASQRDYFAWFNIYHVHVGATDSADIRMRARYRAPTPTPGAALDFSVANVMAFQASQRWDNSLPLAAGRATALRVFVDLGSSNAADLHSPIMAYLYSPGCLPELGLDSSYASPLPVSNWNTSNPERTAVLSDPVDTLNFNLPLACTTPGVHHFTVYIPPTNSNPERIFTNNTYNFTLTFQERRPLNVHVVRISLREAFFCPGDARDEPPWSAVGPALQKLVRMEPTVVNIIDGGTDDYCASPRDESLLAGWWWINLGLTIRFGGWMLPSAPGWIFDVPVPMAYGLLDGAECVGSRYCPLGSTPMVLNHSWVSSGMTTRSTTSAHEVGHARGLLHASNAHGESGGGDWVAWPYLHGAFSQLGPGETWGYEPLAIDAAHPQGVVYAPVSPTFTIPTPPNPDVGYTHELMSYGNDPRWLSDINWNNLFYSFRPPSSGAPAVLPAAPSLPGRYLLVGGVQNTDGSFDIAATRPIEDPTGGLATLLAESTSPEASAYTLQLKALDGTVLATQTFTPATQDGDKQASFQLYILYPDGVASAAILDGTQVVFSRMLSSEAPVVSITSPTASGAYDQSVTLNWDASDPDGDPLSFDISYSPDGGVTWQGVRALLPTIARSFTMDLHSLPGSENAFFKVTASDGLNTTDAITAAPLIISRKAPTAQLTSLTDGAHFTTQQVICLEGTMMDAEDEPPFTDADFVWTSDRDGIIGAGQNTTVYGLTPGRHVITLTVTDSDGMTGSASVSIVVDSPFTYLPVLRR